MALSYSASRNLFLKHEEILSRGQLNPNNSQMSNVSYLLGLIEISEYNSFLDIIYNLLISYFECSYGIKVSFLPCTMNTEHLIYIIFYKLSYVYFAIKLPNFPTN